MNGLSRFARGKSASNTGPSSNKPSEIAHDASDPVTAMLSDEHTEDWMKYDHNVDGGNESFNFNFEDDPSVSTSLPVIAPRQTGAVQGKGGGLSMFHKGARPDSTTAALSSTINGDSKTQKADISQQASPPKPQHQHKKEIALANTDVSKFDSSIGPPQNRGVAQKASVSVMMDLQGHKEVQKAAEAQLGSTSEKHMSPSALNPPLEIAQKSSILTEDDQELLTRKWQHDVGLVTANESTRIIPAAPRPSQSHNVVSKNGQQTQKSQVSFFKSKPIGSPHLGLNGRLSSDDSTLKTLPSPNESNRGSGVLKFSHQLQTEPMQQAHNHDSSSIQMKQPYMQNSKSHLEPDEKPVATTFRTPSALRRSTHRLNNHPVVTPGLEQVHIYHPESRDQVSLMKSAMNSPKQSITLTNNASTVTPLQDIQNSSRSTDITEMEEDAIETAEKPQNFEELNVQFLCLQRDLEDSQNEIGGSLLDLRGTFASVYAQSLKDQAQLFDILCFLENTCSLPDALIMEHSK